MVKTYIAKEGEIRRQWLLVDADGKTLGRLAVSIANLLRGRNKPVFAPQSDVGDFVVVINAEKVRLTGNKEQAKEYQRYSGYRGGLKRMTAASVREHHPERLIQAAVKGMLPRNNLSRTMYRRLKVYAGTAHPHTAQQPQPVQQ